MFTLDLIELVSCLGIDRIGEFNRFNKDMIKDPCHNVQTLLSQKGAGSQDETCLPRT